MIDIALRKVMQADDRRFELDVRLRTESRRVVLFGPSGAGKSLTLRAVAGLLRPDSGHIAVNGRVFYDGQRDVFLPPQQRRVAYLFQDYALFPHLTVGQNVAFGLRAGWLSPPGAACPNRRNVGSTPLNWVRSPTVTLGRFQAARSSVRRWRGHWRPSRISSCWMSHFLRWMRNCAARCGGNCVNCSMACPCP